MGNAEERVAEVERVFETRLGPDEIYAAIQRSAAAAKVAAGGGKLQELARQEQQDGSDAVYFAVLMGIGVEHGRIAVRWWPERPGWHRAKVHVISYDTSQVAPLAPKTIPILRCVRRFVAALEVEFRKDTAKGAATRTDTSTPTEPVTAEPTDPEIDHLVELVERGVSGGTLSDAELDELAAAGITPVHEPGREVEATDEVSSASEGNPSMADARRRLVEEGFVDESADGPGEGVSEATGPAGGMDPRRASAAAGHHGGVGGGEFCTQCGNPVEGRWQFCGACGASTTHDLAATQQPTTAGAGDPTRPDDPAPSGARPGSSPDPGLRQSIQAFGQPGRTKPSAPASSARRRPPVTRASPQYIGDADLGGVPLRQLVDALCWVIAGIAVIVFGAQPDVGSGWAVVIGLLGIGYGLRVLFGSGSYWTSNFVYVIALLAVFAALGAIF